MNECGSVSLGWMLCSRGSGWKCSFCISPLLRFHSWYTADVS